MNIKPVGTLLLVTGAMLLGIGIGYHIQAPRPCVEVVPVVVAGDAMPAGCKIDNPQIQLTLRYDRVGAQPEGCFCDVREVAGKRLRRPLTRGEACTLGDLAADVPLFRPIPPGYRGVTISVQDIDPRVTIGAKVDVVCAITDDGGETTVTTILEDTRVIAANHIEYIPSVATLAVHPADVDRVARAKIPGAKFYLAIRADDDHAILQRQGGLP